MKRCVVRIEIKDDTHRNNVIVALVNSGYEVWLEERWVAYYAPMGEVREVDE